jgi:hypothetical protein
MRSCSRASGSDSEVVSVASSGSRLSPPGPRECRLFKKRRFRVSGGLSRAATSKVASGRGALFSPRRATAGHGEKSWTEAWVILRSDNPARDAFPQSAQDEVAPRIAPVSFSWRDINRSEDQDVESHGTSCRPGDSSRRGFVRPPCELSSPWFSVALRGQIHASIAATSESAPLASTLRRPSGRPGTP